MAYSTNGHRYRENSGAHTAAWVLGILFIIILLVALAMNFNGSQKMNETPDAPSPAGDSSQQNGNQGGMIFGFFIFLIIIILLFNSSNVYYRYDDDSGNWREGYDTKGAHGSNEYVLIIYGAKWCGYTQKFVSELGGISALSKDSTELPVYTIYVECEKGSNACPANVGGFPTSHLMCIESGDIIEVFTGYQPGQAFTGQLKQAIDNHKSGGGGSPSAGSGSPEAGPDATEKAKNAIEQMAAALMKSIDTDGDGSITKPELVSAGERLVAGACGSN